MLKRAKNQIIGKTMRSIAEILSDFSQPIPVEMIKTKPVFQRKQRTGEVSYVSWSDYVRLLLQFAPGYGWSIRTQYLGERIVVEGSLTICAQEGNFLYEATGVAYTDDEGYGDPVYDAESSAMRRACAKAGLGLHLWEKERESRDYGGLVSSNNGGLVSSPKLISEAQQKRLYAIAYKESNLQKTDVVKILASYGYESAKDISQDNYEKIIEQIKQPKITKPSEVSSEFLSKAEREQIGTVAAANGLSTSDIKAILAQLGYEKSSLIPKSRLGIVLEKVKSTYPCDFWVSPLDAQSWAMAYLQDRGSDMGLQEIALEFSDLEPGKGQTKYRAWFEYISQMAQLQLVSY